MQAERQPDYPLLYSQQGFIFCDLLRAAPERAAWETVLSSRGCQPCESSHSVVSRRDEPLWGNSEGSRPPLALKYIASCRAVSQRAATALQVVLNGSRNLLNIALAHLTLGCAALYAAILESSTGFQPVNPSTEHRQDARATLEIPAGSTGTTLGTLEHGQDARATLETARHELDAAVTGLRRAGTQDHIPRGLLTRAWLRFLAGTRTGHDSAQSDLDEAWEIAERGPMKLFMADILLTRARLFGSQVVPLTPSHSPSDGASVVADPESGGPEGYPWESPAADLAAAEKLINDCGYHRRDEELADAKAVLLGV